MPQLDSISSANHYYQNDWRADPNINRGRDITRLRERDRLVETEAKDVAFVRSLNRMSRGRARLYALLGKTLFLVIVTPTYVMLLRLPKWVAFKMKKQLTQLLPIFKFQVAKVWGKLQKERVMSVLKSWHPARWIKVPRVIIRMQARIKTRIMQRMQKMARPFVRMRAQIAHIFKKIASVPVRAGQRAGQRMVQLKNLVQKLKTTASRPFSRLANWVRSLPAKLPSLRLTLPTLNVKARMQALVRKPALQLKEKVVEPLKAKVKEVSQAVQVQVAKVQQQVVLAVNFFVAPVVRRVDVVVKSIKKRLQAMKERGQRLLRGIERVAKRIFEPLQRKLEALQRKLESLQRKLESLQRRWMDLKARIQRQLLAASRLRVKMKQGLSWLQKRGDDAWKRGAKWAKRQVERIQERFDGWKQQVVGLLGRFWEALCRFGRGALAFSRAVKEAMHLFGVALKSLVHHGMELVRSVAQHVLPD